MIVALFLKRERLSTLLQKGQLTLEGFLKRFFKKEIMIIPHLYESEADN